MSDQYYLDEYVSGYINKYRIEQEIQGDSDSNRAMNTFSQVCEKVLDIFKRDELSSDSTVGDKESLKRQKRAIQGYRKEVSYYKDRIKEILDNNNLNDTQYPVWYSSLVDAIFNENWGLAGIAPWVENQDKVFVKSTSAKIIGENIFFDIGGTMVIQPQKFTADRLDQLKRALLIDEAGKKVTDDYSDVLLLDGTRVTIYGEHKTKKGRSAVIFRKYILNEFTFENQAELGTIPEYAVDFFKLKVQLGFNVVFLGGTNTGKSTFYETYQRYEKPHLQGIQIETDPEVDLAHLMPNSPVIELIADDNDILNVMKPILRSDPEYITVGEARTGAPLYLANKVASKGARRVKVTYHSLNGLSACEQMAEEIQEVVGGKLSNHMRKIARNFDYFVELFYYNNDKSKKRLKAIYEVCYDEINHQIGIHILCKFNLSTGVLEWVNRFGDDKYEIGLHESEELTIKFKKMIEEFSTKYPYKGQASFYPICD